MFTNFYTQKSSTLYKHIDRVSGFKTMYMPTGLLCIQTNFLLHQSNNKEYMVDQLACLRECKLEQTYTDETVDDVGHGSETDTLLVSSQVTRQVRWQPLHDDVVGPVHGKVCHIHGPQRPVTYKLRPSHVRVCHLQTTQQLTNLSRLTITGFYQVTPRSSKLVFGISLIYLVEISYFILHYLIIGELNADSRLLLIFRIDFYLSFV